MDKYEEVPCWRETYGINDRPEYILKNGRARNVYGLLEDIHALQDENKKLKELLKSNNISYDVSKS